MRKILNMIVKFPIAMKCAFGENPKRCYRDKCDSTRMSTARLAFVTRLTPSALTNSPAKNKRYLFNLFMIRLFLLSS